MKDQFQEHLDVCEYCMGDYLCPSAVIIVKSLLSSQEKELEEEIATRIKTYGDLVDSTSRVIEEGETRIKEITEENNRLSIEWQQVHDYNTDIVMENQELKSRIHDLVEGIKHVKAIDERDAITETMEMADYVLSFVKVMRELYHLIK